jgi:hypothetical protein
MDRPSDYVWINRICCNFGFDMVPLAQWIVGSAYDNLTRFR